MLRICRRTKFRVLAACFTLFVASWIIRTTVWNVTTPESNLLVAPDHLVESQVNINGNVTQAGRINISNTHVNMDIINSSNRDSMSSTTSFISHNSPSKGNTTIKVKDKSQESLLFYNRVPKCGSSTLTFLTKNMSKLLKYNFRNAAYSTSMKPAKQIVFADLLINMPRPMAYVAHVYFVDFERFNKAPPVYINLVRDPIDRFSSHYRCCYASRRGTSALTKMSVDECVRNRAKICNAPDASPQWHLMLRYFCGQDQICSGYSRGMLERAKLNVAKHYTLVGYLEDLPAFNRLVEVLLPQFFTGLPNMFHVVAKNPKKNASRKDPRKNVTLSPESVEYLKHKHGLEYEFYNFIKERFHKIYNTYL